MIEQGTIERVNADSQAKLRADYDALGEHLSRRGIDVNAIKSRVADYGVAIPSCP